MMVTRRLNSGTTIPTLEMRLGRGVYQHESPSFGFGFCGFGTEPSGKIGGSILDYLMRNCGGNVVSKNDPGGEVLNNCATGEQEYLLIDIWRICCVA